jgi:hypothetical protein
VLNIGMAATKGPGELPEHASFRHISAQVFETHGGDLHGGFIGDTLVNHGDRQ